MRYLRALLTVYALGAFALGFVGIATLIAALTSGNLPMLVTGIIVLALALAHLFQTIDIIEVSGPALVSDEEEPIHQEPAKEEEKTDG